MIERILITYASKSNATAEYAGFIAGEMISRGYSIDQINLREIKKPDLSKYDKIILGTGVRIGRWYGPAKNMLKRNEIKDKKLAIFIACGTAIDHTKVSEAIANYIDPMLNKYNLEAYAKTAFPGKIPGSKQELIIESSLVKSWVDTIE